MNSMNLKLISLYLTEDLRKKAALEEAKENILLFMSDAAAENKAFYNMLLNDGFNKLIHVTCCAHGIHNLLKTLPDLYPKAHELVSEMKNIYAKAPTKRNRWKEVCNKFISNLQS